MCSVVAEGIEVVHYTELVAFAVTAILVVVDLSLKKICQCI